MNPVTDTEINCLRNDAAEASDLDMVETCTVALADGNVTIHSSKGGTTGDVWIVAAWQAEHQGAFATIGGLDVSAIDFDADHLTRTVATLRAAARAVCAEAILSALSA